MPSNLILFKEPERLVPVLFYVPGHTLVGKGDRIMTRNKRFRKTAIGIPAGISIGVAVSALVTVVGAMIFAWLIAAERAEERGINAGCFLIQMLAAMAGTLYSCSAIKEKRLLVCGITAMGNLLLLFIMSLAFGGKAAGIGSAALAVIAGGGVTLLLGLIGNRSGVKRNKIPRFR